MTLNNCPSDVLFIIISFLNNNSSTSLIKTCKTINRHGDDFGYISHISVDYSVDIMTFIRHFCKHSQCMKSVYINGLDNPQVWMPHYVEKMVFDHCAIFSYINPGKQSHITKSLIIRDYHRYKNKQTLHINWECFPNLEELELYVHDVVWTGSSVMKKLKHININTNRFIHICTGV